MSEPKKNIEDIIKKETEGQDTFYDRYKNRIGPALYAAAHTIKKSPLHIKATAKGVARFTYDSTKFIWDSYLNPDTKEERRQNRKALYNVLIGPELNYSHLTARVLSAPAPLPMKTDAAYFGFGFVHGLFAGRTQEADVNIITALMGADNPRHKSIFQHGIYVSEYAMDFFAGAQNGLLSFALTWGWNSFTSHDVPSLVNKIVIGLYIGWREKVTIQDHHLFYKKGVYKPCHAMVTTPSGAGIYAVSYFHQRHLEKKRINRRLTGSQNPHTP